MLENLELIDFVSLVSSLVSLIVGIIAIALSVVFFFSAKKSEGEASKSLVAIDNQVKALSIINNDLLKNAIQHLGDSNSKMIDALRREYDQNVNRASSTPSAEGDNLSKPDIREDILATIKSLEARTGRAVALELFDDIKRKYDFGIVLMELNRMNKENIVKWDESPKPPEAMSAIKIVPKAKT